MSAEIGMRAGALRDVVEGFEPESLGAEASKERFLSLLEEIPEPFSREADPRHVTGSAVVLSPAGVLLHLHKRIDLWVGPGGHVDDDELPHQSAERETYEETGIVARQPPNGPRMVHLDVHKAGEHWHYDLRYVLLASADEPAPPPGESQQVEWVPVLEAMERTDESFREAILAAQRSLSSAT